MLANESYWKDCYEKSEEEKRELLVRLYRERGLKLDPRGAQGLNEAVDAISLEQPGNELKCPNCKVLSQKVSNLQENMKKVEAENATLRTSYKFVESELSRLANALYSYQKNSQNSEEETKVLKQQVSLFQEDFQKEREDREKAQGEIDNLKRKLKEMEELISVLTQQIEFHQEDYSHERAQNQKLRSELQRHFDQNAQPQVQLVYSLPQSETSNFTMPRRATFSGDAIQLPRQPLSASERRSTQLMRSKTLPAPSTFYHGGDVVVDK